jgi:sugar/nucleoside kinase (ribokinase family)
MSTGGRHWVAGPIAWDWVCRVPHLPELGGFVQATRYAGRRGGTAANVAHALASAGIDVELIGYVGDDEPGHAITQELSSLGFGEVQQLPGPTSQVLLIVDEHGERTMIGLTPDHLADVELPVHRMRPGDTLYLAAWVPSWMQATEAAAAAGVRVVTVPPDPDQPFAAHMIIGSHSQIPESINEPPFTAYTRRNRVDLDALIITRGAEGATSYTASDQPCHHPALEADVVDATGAGDAFAAGILLGRHEARSLTDAIRLGNAWGAAAAGSDSSLPPPRATVPA